jgi:hypothetical protein
MRITFVLCISRNVILVLKNLSFCYFLPVNTQNLVAYPNVYKNHRYKTTFPKADMHVCAAGQIDVSEGRDTCNWHF